MATSILYVDDNPDSGRNVIADSKVEFRSIEPSDDLSIEKIIEEIEKIHVVLMDYDLHEEGESSYLDGLELLERFRAAIRHAGNRKNWVPALALLTGKSQELAEQYNCPQVEPFLSRLTNVDWIFPKGVSQLRFTNNVPRQIAGFFSAACAVHRGWGDNDATLDPQLRELLKLNDEKISDWADQAYEEFRATRPPLQELIKRNDGNELLRWLLHIALPFPSCLVDRDWVAVKLRIQPETLRAHLETSESQLAQELELRRYTGPAYEMFDPRYWKAGIDELAWAISRGANFDRDEVRSRLQDMAAGAEFHALNLKQPVLVVSPDDLTHHGAVSELEQSVQIQPDYWPSPLDPPWIRKEDLKKDQSLKNIVVNDDLSRVGE